MPQKTICLINYTLNVGGAERQTADLANYFASKNYKVFIIILRKGASFYKLDDRVICMEPGFYESRSKLGKLIYFLKIGVYVRSTILKLKPGIIFNTAFPSFILFFTIGIKIPFYLSIRCDPTITPRIEMFNIPLKIRQLLYRRCTGIIAQTNYAKEILSKQFKHSTVSIIPNILSNVSNEPFVRENMILSVGRLVKSKGFNYLIQAFARVENESWKVVILGEGPERANLENLIKQMNLTDKILLVGTKSNTLEYYRKSKIFAFVSLSEGFPNALLEAMGSPLPSISFNCNAGPRDMIEDGVNGFLITMYDIDQYVAKLQLLMKDENLRNRFMEASIKLRVKHHSDKICNEYLMITEKNRL